jgi:RimJ/RimL family protein N-acetyltransferase
VVPTLATPRLVLRPLAEADAPEYAAMYADPEVARHITPDGAPLSSEDAWRHMAMLVGHWQLRGFGMWAVAERAAPARLIGRVGCHEPAGWPGFEVGWALARPWWGRGYATEAAAAAVRHAFETLARPRVISLVAPENVASAAVARRLGARRTGEQLVRGRGVDVWAIERDEWLAARAAPA